MPDTEAQREAVSYKEQADHYRDSKQYDLAIENYNAALDLKPDYWQAHANLSIIFSAMGNHSSAVSHAEKSISIMPQVAELHDNIGTIYRESGNYTESIKSHRNAININPALSSAYFNLGLSCEKDGAINEAIKAFENATDRDKNLIHAHIILGKLLHGEGRMDEAVIALQRAIELRPNLPKVHHDLGRIFLEQGKFEEAIASFKRSLESNPDSPETYYNLAIAQQQCGKLDDVIVSYDKALQIDSTRPEMHFNRGVALKERGRLDEAVDSYQAAIKYSSGYAEAYSNLGEALLEQGRYEEAVSALHQALDINPNASIPYTILGMTQVEQHKLDDAVASFQQAVKIDPDNAGYHNNLGILLKKQGDLEGAIAAYNRALVIDPRGQQAHVNLAIALKKQGRLEEAGKSYRQALELSPEDIRLASDLCHQLQNVCDWKEVKALDRRIDRLISESIKNDGNDFGDPFAALSRTENIEQQLFVAKSYSRKISRKVQVMKNRFTFEGRKKNLNKLRIGYLSYDFRNHPVANLISGVFREHNRAEFDVFIYSYGPDDGSENREKIIQYSDKFVDISEYSNSEAANQIYNDKVDVLVELMGYTTNNRLEICLLRPTPIQVSYLGFPGTTGAEFMDYILTDRCVTPIEHAPFYSEKFAFLPDTYLPTDADQQISSKTFTRPDFGLPEDSFVFCCFCQPYKINELCFDIWMRVLKDIENSVLWLSGKNPLSIDNLKKEAQKRGIDADRIIFANKVPGIDEHLRRIQLADLVLDTQIYNGHTTTADALWAGVPVVATEGRHFASRVSSSLLKAVGLPELVTTSMEEYEFLIKRLDQQKLVDIRQKLDRNRKTEPLFDTKRITRNLEKAYSRMWERYVQGEKPGHFDVVSNS